MPCERAEQPLSRSALEDTAAPAPMEILMAGSLEDICLLACSPQSPGTCGGPGAAPGWEGEPEPWGHVTSPELPQAGNGSPSRGDTWRPRSCPSWEWESEPWGHVAASELPSAGRREPLSWLEACTQGYPVLRVPTHSQLQPPTHGFIYWWKVGDIFDKENKKFKNQ
jgi:hypothetical protein